MFGKNKKKKFLQFEQGVLQVSISALRIGRRHKATIEHSASSPPTSKEK
jgi:hypothetical protein